MARMYGSVKGSRGPCHRLGGQSLSTTAASWQGGISVWLYVKSTGKGKTLRETDMALVRMITWNGIGTEKVLYDGPVGEFKPRRRR